MTNLQYVGLAWVLVAIWYWSDTQQARAKGKKLPLVVHPLALLVLAARRLWQERAFVMVVLALLLVGSGLEYGVSRPLFYPRPVEPVLAPPVPTSGRSGPAIAAPPPVSRSARAGVRPFERPRPGLTEAVRLNLQRLREDGYPAWQAIQHGLPGKDSFPGALWRDPITSAALMLLAVMFLLRLRRAHPAWLGERAARQVRGVLITVVIGFVLQVLFTAWNMSVYNSLDTSGWLRYRLPFNIMATLVALVHCVAYGFVFACILQIARRGRCSYAAAIRTGLIVWLPMLAYFAVIRISTLVMQLLSSSILESVPYPLWIWLTSAISLVLMLVPWLIVRHRLTFREGARRQFQLLSAQRLAILPFLLRTIMIFAPLYLAAGLLSGGDALTNTIWLLLSQAVSLLAMMVAALWLVELERAGRLPATTTGSTDLIMRSPAIR